ncbi:dermonecrotic toxin domain-containing protein [Pseudomonas sp. GL-RE-19]|uniref:dermonecrotic toxin domain-containing protein n=1 Tax=Pseudomonas sp. GL-RE-19 TaxID=2832389 RepID=UPI001CBAD036
MSDLHGSNSQEIPGGVSIDSHGKHYRRTNDVIPAAIKNAPLARLKSLLALEPQMPEWYSGAREIDRQYLKQLMDERWRLQGVLDQTLGDLQHDINAFAEPLLKTALQSKFNTVENINGLTVQLEVPSTIIFGIDTGASRVRRSTLLEAALHNFEEDETAPGALRSSSGIYRKDSRGSLSLETAITLPAFAALCRSLDIGGQYQRHIKSVLLSETPQAQRTLQRNSVASEKAALHVAALIARLKGDISDHAYGKLGQVREGRADITLYDQPLQCHRLSLMGFRMTGIVLFSAVIEPSQVKREVEALTPALLRFWIDWSRRIPVLPGQEYDRFKLLQAFFANGPQGLSDELLRREDIYQQSRLTGPLIAYVPDDPEHPLKEYPSLTAFMKTLIGQLRNADYQAFFSRFVAQKDKGLFFARVNERLTTFTWHEREPLDMGPWWREAAVENPDAEPITNQMTGDLWVALFLQRRDKAIADARLIAVPTGDEDANARFKRLTSYLSIGWNLFNFAAMLVPGLGEAMLGIMVAQMLAEVAEGVEDWSKGDKEQASAYFNGVLINFAQLALMGAGHVLPGTGVAPIKVSPFVEGLKPVEVGGKERLWNPDLAPYEQPVVLPDGAKASDTGLYRHQDQDLLRLDDKCYAVRQDPDTGRHRLQHATRADAYQPLLEHNGAGSWKTELDQPLEWDKGQILRRLGASVDGFSDETLEQILTASGVHENVLRRLHVEQQTPPALLADTLKRFKAHADAQACAEQIMANRIGEEWADYAVRSMTEMGGWSGDKAIEVFQGPGLTGASIKNGYAQASLANTLQMTRSYLLAGALPERVVGFLDEQALRELLPEWLSGDAQKRAQALREQWAAQVGRRKRQLFDLLYSHWTRSDDPLVNLLKEDFAEISISQAQELLGEAHPSDVQHLSEKKRVPLRLAEQARKAAEQLRVTRAYEGLYLDALHSADTARLELHSLAALPGWPTDLRLEVREYSFGGALTDSLGPVDAPIRKVLILDEDGKYQARDDSDQHLHGADNLYAAVLHAFPDSQRTTLGFGINEAARLEQAIKARPLDRQVFEPILRDNPNYKPTYDPTGMRLRGGMRGYARQAPHGMGLRRRAQALYPDFTSEEVETLLAQFSQGEGAVHERLAVLETEFNQLNRTLQRWMNSPTQSSRFTPAGVAEWHARNNIYKALRQCWQRTGPEGIEASSVVRPQALRLDNIPRLSRLLETLPKLEANFDHVTSLSLRGGQLRSGHLSFLDSFHQVRYLNLQDNLLTALPQAMKDMRHLTHLFLDGNNIELDVVAVDRLKNLTRMMFLRLRGNPLKLIPNISRMPHLQVLLLGETGLDSWPVGLFSQPRPRSIYLDLSDNPISRIPEVAPGSFRAELLARTVISRSPRWISPENLDFLKSYIESVGMDPERPYPPRGVIDSAEWGTGMSEQEWQKKQEVWDAVEDEFNSMPFFNELDKLTNSADFKAGGTYQTELTAKVWRMLEAMARDSELRIKLFNEAATPTECVDGVTQLFNAMGVQVLVHEAYALERADLIETQLLELALGKSRLDELAAIARRRVSERLAKGERFRRYDADGEVTGTIDEVEVHLAYMTDLAERLDLPWQARGMQFRSIAEVSKEMIEAAFQRIKALEEGDLLIDRIFEQPLWKTWLESTYREELNGLKRRIDATIDLQDALQRRAEGAGLSTEEKAAVEAQIKGLCSELGKSETDFADGRLMTDEEYVQALDDIDLQITQLLKKLTREAMNRARLDRLRIESTQ